MWEHAGIESGVEAAIHSVRSVWRDEGYATELGEVIGDKYREYAEFLDEPGNKIFTEEELDFGPIDSEEATLYDAHNAFYRMRRYVALWTNRHLWPKGRRLTFNC